MLLSYGNNKAGMAHKNVTHISIFNVNSEARGKVLFVVVKVHALYTSLCCFTQLEIRNCRFYDKRLHIVHSNLNTRISTRSFTPWCIKTNLLYFALACGTVASSSFNRYTLTPRP